jgi:hypothetical protein
VWIVQTETNYSHTEDMTFHSHELKFRYIFAITNKVANTNFRCFYNLILFGSTHPLPHTPSRRSALLVKHRVNFTFITTLAYAMYQFMALRTRFERNTTKHIVVSSKTEALYWAVMNRNQLLAHKPIALQISRNSSRSFWNETFRRTEMRSFYVFYSRSFYLFPERDSDSRPQRELKHRLLPAKIDCVCVGHVQSWWVESETSSLISCLTLNDLLRSLYSRLVSP